MRGFGLSPTLAFFIMTWDNLINIFVQPWVGVTSDRTWTRFGRRKPWLLAGVPLAALGFVFIPLAGTILAILVAILVVNVGMAIFRAPAAALLGDLFPPGQRSQVRGIASVMAGSSGALALVAGSFLFERAGRAVPFIASSVFMVVFAALAALLIIEPNPTAQGRATAFGPGKIVRPVKEAEAAKPTSSVLSLLRALWQAEDHRTLLFLLTILLSFMVSESLQAGLSSFAVFTLGLSPGEAARFAALSAVAIILFAFPGGLIGARIGRQRSISIGLAGLFLVAGGGALLIRHPATLAIVLVLAGFFWALVVINDLPLLYDLGDEGQIGAYTGVYFVATQAAAVLGPTLAGFSIDLAGSHRVLFAFAAVCALLAWVALRQVRPPTVETAG
ncbi:MAG: MFS transporter [Chloroflexi bacterium]|nr:MFS transporter [Chloroflexota bacterium]